LEDEEFDDAGMEEDVGWTMQKKLFGRGDI
jgi:hypothetical protein